jgi:hypothetical protein
MDINRISKKRFNSLKIVFFKNIIFIFLIICSFIIEFKDFSKGIIISISSYAIKLILKIIKLNYNNFLCFFQIKLIKKKT